MTIISSYRTLNQIFYHPHNKFDVPESIHLLEEFIYKSKVKTKEQPPSTQEKETISVGIPPQQSVIPQPQSKIDAPPQKITNRFAPFFTDTIFWSVFYHVYGEKEYTMITSKHGNRMLEEKKKIMEHFQKAPKTLKQSTTKFTNDRIQETMSEFMCTKNCSSFLETAAYALYYNLTIIIIDEQKRTYLIFKDK